MKRLMASGRIGLSLFAILLFLGSVVWAKSRDPFERIRFKIKTAAYGKAEAVAVLPKPVRRVPVVYFIYGSGGSLIHSGNTLRQLADLGMASVTIEYNQTSQAAFDEQFAALQAFVSKQKWADTSHVVWIGASLGAQRTLDFLIRYPESAPQIYVRIGGGLIPEIDQKLSKSKQSSTKALLIHGENDEIFPIADAKKSAERFQRSGMTTELKIIPRQGHIFQPDSALLIRCLAENIKQTLTPGLPRPEFPIARNYSFVICVIPAFAWGAFWLGLRRRMRPKDAMAKAPLNLFEKVLRLTVVVLATWLSVEATIHLVLPRMIISDNTLSIARRKLIDPKWTGDFDELAGKEYWSAHKLNTLLTHVELANYCVYELINWTLQKEVYKTFVLSPVIDSESDPELNWRRSLWEFFYPRIRKENSTQSAAEIIVRNLRERVTIDPRFAYATGIESIWRNQITTPEGFERIYVAALRSTGIAARLNKDKKAESWTGSEWKSAPRPLIETWLDGETIPIENP